MESRKSGSTNEQPPLPLEPPDFDHYEMGQTWIAIEPPEGGREAEERAQGT